MEINRLIHAKCEVVFWQLSFMSVSYGKCCFLLGTCLPAFFFFFNADSKFYLDKYQFNITQSVLTGEDVNYCGDAEDA